MLPTAVLSRMKAWRLSRSMLTIRCKRHRTGYFPSRTSTAPIILATEGYARLVDLDDARERRPLWRYHGSAELLEEKPSCLVAAEPKLRLELEGGHAIRMRR
jgi:hypothetical protein